MSPRQCLGAAREIFTGAEIVACRGTAAARRAIRHRSRRARIRSTSCIEDPSPLPIPRAAARPHCQCRRIAVASSRGSFSCPCRDASEGSNVNRNSNAASRRRFPGRGNVVHQVHDTVSIQPFGNRPVPATKRDSAYNLIADRLILSPPDPTQLIARSAPRGNPRTPRILGTSTADDPTP